MKRYHLLVALSIVCFASGCSDWLKFEVQEASVACDEGETKCIQGNIHTCTADGNWPDEATTECGEMGCSEGTIQSKSNPITCHECGTDEAKCEGANLITCSNHKKIKTECEYGCVTTKTNAYCRKCKDDEKKCENRFIVSCTKEGEKIGKWDDDHKQSCENGCFPGARGSGSEVSCYECGDADKLKCFRDDETKVTTIKRCLAHNWYDEEVCASGCVEGTEAKCKLCNHGDKKYYNNEDGYCVEQECKDNQYQDVKTADVSCNSDLSGNGECLNGQSRCFDKGNEQGAFQYCENGAWKEFGIPCDSNNPCAVLGNNKCIGNDVGQICSDDGKSLVACPNKASCEPDFSGCAECQNGTSKCDGNKLSTCQNGEYQETECKTGTHCEAKDGQAQCVQHECENNQQRCQGNIIQTCENYKWKTTDACVDGEQCKANDGIASCSCLSGTSYCDGTTAKNCQDGQWNTTTCEQNTYCAKIGGEAKCIECESGTKCKDEHNIMNCQNNAWGDATLCSDGMSCTGEDGKASCVCTEVQAMCDSDKSKIKKCNADGAYGSAESCGTDKHCEGVAGSAICTADPMECAPGTKQCNGNDLQTCSSKGKWEKAETCDKGCNNTNMACNDCNVGEKKCEGSKLKTCENGKWKSTQCGYGCLDATTCKVCEGKICKDANTLKVCKDNKWEENLCEYGCYNTACKQCKLGSVICRAAKNADECTETGEWKPIACNGGCVSKTNTCYPDCTPAKKVCDGDIPKICNEKGVWEEKEKCEFGCNKETVECYPECKPGDKQCDGDIAKSCTPNGEWEEKKCETGCTPQSGSCYPECKPGTKKCVGKISKTCDNKGNWNSNGKYCFNGCDQNTGNCNSSVGDDCNTGETKCVSAKSMSVCIDNHWLTITCKSGDTCSDDKNKCINYSGGCTMGTCKAPGLPYAEIYLSIPCNHNKFDYSSIELCQSGCNTCYDNE